MSEEPVGDDEQAEIVIVEDDTSVADLYAEWLSDDYDVTIANNAEEALTAISSSTDVILLDRRLPDRSGDEILGEIRNQGNDAPVAMVSAVDPTPELQKLDIDEYLKKPVEKEQLTELVEDLLRRTKLDGRIQQYLSLVSRKETIEAENRLEQLQSDTEYQQLTETLRSKREELIDVLATRASRDISPLDHYTWRQKLWTGIGICIPAVLLVLIHILFPTAIVDLFQQGSPQSNLTVGYMSSFIHINDGHLYGNLGGYLTVALLTYILCMRMLTVRWFYITGILLLTVLPLLTNIFLYDVFDVFYAADQIRFVGFSQVVSGFVGFSFVSFITLLRLLYRSRSAFFAGGYIILQAISVILYLNSSRLLPVVVGACLFMIGGFIAERISAYRRDQEEWLRILENTTIIALVGIVYTAGGLGLVPTTEIEAQFGILSHLIGFGLGAVMTISTALLLNVYPIRDRLKSKGYTLPDNIV